MSPRLSRAEAVQLALGLLLVAATFIAFAIGLGLAEAAVSAGLVLAFLLVVVAGRRHSDTLDVMSGVGDERARSLYTRAIALTGTILSYALPAWWLVTVAQGDPDPTLTLVCALFGTTFVLSVAVVARRGRGTQ